VIGIIRRDRGASALIYTTRSCGETRSLFFCQNRSEQNSLAVLGCAGMPATRRTRGTSAYLNNTRGVATTGKMCAADVAVGPERTPAAPPRERISADGDHAKAGDLVMFERFTPPDGGTEVENGSGTVLFDEDRSSMRTNHTGQSGPRTELLELLDWLRRLRRRQRFLGFKESDLTYLYDIPVWVVDNCAGVCEMHALFYFLLQESPPHLAISCHLRHLRRRREQRREWRSDRDDRHRQTPRAQLPPNDITSVDRKVC
jgi:hypothetical protein